MSKHTPFHCGTQFCGTQFSDWQERNCFNCRKYDHDSGESTCEIDQALLVAMFGDGTVEDSIARRMGYTDHEGHYSWDCPERQETVA